MPSHLCPLELQVYIFTTLILRDRHTTAELSWPPYKERDNTWVSAYNHDGRQYPKIWENSIWFVVVKGTKIGLTEKKSVNYCRWQNEIIRVRKRGSDLNLNHRLISWLFTTVLQLFLISIFINYYKNTFLMCYNSCRAPLCFLLWDISNF